MDLSPAKDSFSLDDDFDEKAFVEMNAKIASGYHADELKSDEIVETMNNLRTVRLQCGRLYELAEQDKLRYFSINLKNLPNCVDRVIGTIKSYYPDLHIPYHSRLRHFPEQRLEALKKKR